MWAPRRWVNHCGGGTYKLQLMGGGYIRGARRSQLRGKGYEGGGAQSGPVAHRLRVGLRASCLSLMVSRHTCATTDEGGSWEPPARLSFPTGGWTRLSAVKHSSPFSANKSLCRSTECKSCTGLRKDALRSRPCRLSRERRPRRHRFVVHVYAPYTRVTVELGASTDKNSSSAYTRGSRPKLERGPGGLSVTGMP